MRARARTALPVSLLSVLAIIGWEVALEGIENPPASPPSSPSAIAAQARYQSSHRRLISAGRGPVVLHMLRYVSAGGMVTIRWYDSDFEPLSPRKAEVVSLVIDGHPVSSTVKSSLTGVFEDGQGVLVWRGSLAAGVHELEIRARGSAAWGMPYTDPGKLGLDELIVDRGTTRAT